MFAPAEYSTAQEAPGQFLISTPGHSWIGPVWFVGIPLAALLIAFLVTGATRLDYVNSVAQHPQPTITAILDQKPNYRRMRLKVFQGDDLAFPVWSDRAGQQEAVNQFLQAGVRSPQR